MRLLAISFLQMYLGDVELPIAEPLRLKVGDALSALSLLFII